MAVRPAAPKAGAEHHHRMIEHHARKLREMAHKPGARKVEPTKAADKKGGMKAAHEEKRMKKGEFAGKRK